MNDDQNNGPQHKGRRAEDIFPKPWTTEFTTFVHQKTVSRPLTLFPGVVGGTIEHARMVHDLYEQLETHYPVDSRTSAGYLGNGITTGWSQLLNLSVKMNPTGVPPTDGPAIAIRALEEGTVEQQEYAARFRRGYTPDEEEIARHVIDLIVGIGDPKPYAVKRAASLGLPTMTKDLRVKALLPEMWNRDGMDILGMVEAGQLRRMFDEKRLVMMATTGIRLQPDALESVNPYVTKERYVMDWLGEFKVANKNLPPQYYHKDFPLFASRTRQFTAYPNATAEPLRMVSAAIQAHMETSYPVMFTHRSREEINEKLKYGKRVIMSDVKNHDQVANPHFIRLFVETLNKYFVDDLCTFSQKMFQLPFLYRSDYIGGTGTRATGYPFSPDVFTSDIVNPSGIPYTSIVAKLLGVFYGILTLIKAKIIGWRGDRRLTGRELRNEIHALMKGDHPAGIMLNAGDNLVFSLTQDVRLTNREVLDLCHLAILDETASFVGLTAIDVNGTTVLVPSSTSLVTKLVNGEHDVNSHFRKFWAFGYEERFNTFYQYNPVNFGIRDLMDGVFKKHYGHSLTEVARANYNEPRPTAMKSIYDIEFLQDPSVVYYKFPIELITPEIFDEHYLAVGVDQFSQFWSAITK